MDRAWDFIWNCLYDDRTGMFYNHLADDAVKASDYLPSPEMIGRLVPNPAGYGTSMEDCMLNAGLMMDAVVARYEAENNGEMREYATGIYRGLMLGATVSDKCGFIPRGVSPVDCKSHYIDTSRDQYTDWLYAVYRFYFSELSSDGQKECIRGCITYVARMFENEVIPGNDYNFLREDGKIGVAGKMWGNVAPHEYLRLPMLYLLTWKITGDTHYKELYLTYRDQAIEGSRKFVPLTAPTYAALQMQYSMRVVYDLDDTPSVRSALLEIMSTLATPYENMAVDQANALMTEEGREWLEIPYTKWQSSKFRYAGYWGDMAYFIPEPSDFREHKSYYPLRTVGEGVVIAATCPSYEISPATLDTIIKMSRFVNYNKHKTCAPIALLEAYWLCRRNRN